MIFVINYRKLNSIVYADDMVIYCLFLSVVQILEFLQPAFLQSDVVKSRLTQLNLVLNADKSKCMLFSNGKELTSNLPKISTAQGFEIEVVKTCLGI